MSTPYHFAPRLPAPPHPTPVSASAYILPTHKTGKAPIRNPYDKFTQPEFDAWIGDITGALRRALGQEEEITDSIPQLESTQIEKPHKIPQYTPPDLESDDEVVDDSFAEIKARRKGKARDPREGPGLGKGDTLMPIEIPSSDEEEEEEVELSIIQLDSSESEGEQEDEEDKEEEDYSAGEEDYSWTRGQSSSVPLSSPQKSRSKAQAQRVTNLDEEDEEEDEEVVEEDDQEEEAEYEAYDEYDEEEEEERPVHHQQAGPEEVELIEIISDDDEPAAQSTQTRQIREEIYEEAEEQEEDAEAQDDEGSEIYEYSDDENKENEVLDISPPVHSSSLIRRPSNEPEFVQECEEEGEEGEEEENMSAEYLSDDEIEEVQPSGDDTSFPPRVPVSPTEANRTVEIPDIWAGPRTYAQDFYSGGEIRVAAGAHVDPHHLGPQDDDLIEELDARREQDELEDEIIQPLDDDASFPPYTAAPEGSMDILVEPWEGPQTYAEDYYFGGDIRTLPGERVDPCFLSGTGDADSGIESFLTPDVLSPNQSESFDDMDDEFIVPPQHYVATTPSSSSRNGPIPADAPIISIDDSDEETDIKQPESTEILEQVEDVDSLYDDSEELPYEPQSVEELIYHDMEYAVTQATLTLEQADAEQAIHTDFSFEDFQSINHLPDEQDEVISTIVDWNNPPAFPTGLPASASGHLATPSSDDDDEPPVELNRENADLHEQVVVVELGANSPVTGEAPSETQDDVGVMHPAQVVDPGRNQEQELFDEPDLEIIADAMVQADAEPTTIVDDTPSSADQAIAPTAVQEVMLAGDHVIVEEVVDDDEIPVDLAPIPTMVEIIPEITETILGSKDGADVSLAMSGTMSNTAGLQKILSADADVAIVQDIEDLREDEPKITPKNTDSIETPDAPDTLSAESDVIAIEVSTQADISIGDAENNSIIIIDNDGTSPSPDPEEDDQEGQDQTLPMASSSIPYNQPLHQLQPHAQGQLPTPPSEKARSLSPLEGEGEISAVVSSPKKRSIEVKDVFGEGDNMDFVQRWDTFGSEAAREPERDPIFDYLVAEVLTDEEFGYTDEDADGEIYREDIEVVSVTGSSDPWEKTEQPSEGTYTVEEPVTEGRLTEEPPEHFAQIVMEFIHATSHEYLEEEPILQERVASREIIDAPLSENDEIAGRSVYLDEASVHLEIEETCQNKVSEVANAESTTMAKQVESTMAVTADIESLDSIPRPLPSCLPSGSPLDRNASGVLQSPPTVLEPTSLSGTFSEMHSAIMQQPTEQPTSPVEDAEAQSVMSPYPSIARNLFGLSGDHASHLEALEAFYPHAMEYAPNPSAPLPKGLQAEMQFNKEVLGVNAADVFGDIKTTKVQTKSTFTNSDTTLLDLSTQPQTFKYPSMTMSMISRKSSIPVLMPDPYPYSLSTPGSSNVLPMFEEVSEDDLGLDNSMSSNSTLEKGSELEDKDKRSIFDDLESLELQYPPEPEQSIAQPLSTVVPAQGNGKTGRRSTTPTELDSNNMDAKNAAAMTASDNDAQKNSESIATPAMKSLEMPSDHESNGISEVAQHKSASESNYKNKSPSEVLAQVTFVKSAGSSKKASKRKRDASPSGSQGPQAAIQSAKAKGKREPKSNRKVKTEELQDTVSGPSTSEQTIYVRPRTTGATSILSRAATDTMVTIASSSAISNNKGLPSSPRSASIVSSAPSDKTPVQSSATASRPNLTHLQSLQPVSLLHAHGQKRKQNLVQFPTKRPVLPSNPPPSRTPTSQAIEQPAPSATVSVVTPTAGPSDIASALASNISSDIQANAPPAPENKFSPPLPVLISSPVQGTPSTISPVPATLSPALPGPSTPSTTVLASTTPSINRPGPITPSVPPSVSNIIRRKHSTPLTSSPITRSHCRYHRISLPKEEGGPRVCFLVPGCSLNDKELMEDEEIEDHGDATQEDSHRMIKDIESLHFHSDLIGVLRQLVGLDILREQEVFYLPQPGEEVTLKFAPRKASISERTAMIRASGESSSYAGSPSYSGYAGSPGSYKAPSVADSTSTSLSARRKNEEDSERGSNFTPTDTEADLTDDEGRHNKRARPSPPEEHKSMGPPTGQSKGKGKSKSKSRRNKKIEDDDPKADQEGKASELAAARKPRKSTSTRGVKRSRTSEVVNGEDADDRDSKKLKTHATEPSIPPSPDKPSS